MTLITGVTEHWIFLLLQPYRPIAVYAFVVGFSVAVLVVKLWMRARNLGRLFGEARKSLSALGSHILQCLSWPSCSLPVFSR